MSTAGRIAEVAGAAALVGAAASLAYVLPGLRPESQLFGRALVAPRRPEELALTFDDGPNPAWTPQLLDLLARYDVRATFFLVGQFAAQERALVRRTHAAGHLIGNHTWTHPNLARTGRAQTRQELNDTQNELEQTIGAPVRFFRPPFGLRRPATLTIARSLGLIPVTWNVIGNDWNAPDADAIVRRVTTLSEKNRRRGYATNLVLHDGGHLALNTDRSRTVEAVSRLLPEWVQTRRLVTLDGWEAEGQA